MRLPVRNVVPAGDNFHPAVSAKGGVQPSFILGSLCQLGCELDPNPAKCRQICGSITGPIDTLGAGLLNALPALL